MHRFLRCTTRELLVLMLVVGVLMAVVASRRHSSQSRREAATRSLCAAAKAGDVQTAAKAVANGADVDAWDEDYTTPLTYAVRGGNLPLVDLLLDAGADPDAFSPLAHAAARGDAAVVERLMAAGSTRDKDRAVESCVAQGREEVLRLLLADGGGQAYVAHAMHARRPRLQQLALARLLLELSRPEDIATYARIGSAVDWAVRAADAELIDLLREFGAPYTAREAAALNRLQEVRQMVEQNPDVVCQRFRPFEDYYGYYYVSKTPRGQEPTLLDIALSKGYRELAFYLIEAGAPLEACVYPNATMLHRAAIGGDAELVRYLANRCLPANGRDGHYYTPLSLAVSRGHADAASALIDIGADLNWADYTARDLLREAAHRNYTDVMRVLIEAGADPYAASSDGKSAYVVALEQWSDEVIALYESELGVQRSAADSRPRQERGSDK